MKKLLKYMFIASCFMLIFSCGSTDSSPSKNITVETPNGSESWKITTTHAINWSDNIDNEVKIELVKSGNSIKTIINSTASDGIYSWTISENLSPASDYKIKISSVQDSNLFDKSNETFTVKDKTTDDYITEGFRYYQNESYDKAINSFNTALNKDNTAYEANIGIGWSNLRLDNFNNSKTNFETGLDKGISDSYWKITDAIGLSSIYIKNSNKTGIENYNIKKILENNITYDSFNFEYDNKIDAVDIHNQLAEIYILYNNFGSDADSINELNAWGQIKKALELDPDDDKAQAIKNFLESGDTSSQISIKKFLDKSLI